MRTPFQPSRPLTMTVFLLWTLTALAVDRSKFRTCQQTSFCRRQRHFTSDTDYVLLPETIRVHLPTEEDKENSDTQEEKTGGVWNSLSKRLLGSTHQHDAHNQQPLDPYVRGPPPQVTGQLVRQASQVTNNNNDNKINWTLTCLADGVVRLRLTEVYGTAQTAYEKARVTYDEVVLEEPHDWQVASNVNVIKGSDVENAVDAPLLPQIAAQINVPVDNLVLVHYGDNTMALVLQIKPFVVRLFDASHIATGPMVVLGQDGQLNFEVRRFKEADTARQLSEENKPEENDEEETKPDKEIVGYWEDGLAIYADGTREEKKQVEDDMEEEDDDTEDHRQLTEKDLEGMWEEKFGSHHDSKPFGPTSVGLDISFPQSRHVYGIPEHAASAVLQPTRGPDAHFHEPYRLYNLDVFEYELDETMALYGHIPFVVSQSVTTGTVGVFWFNPTETFVDVTQMEQADQSTTTTTHWMSESGVMDIFLIPGPDPKSLYEKYGKLTGTTPIPPMFSLGYHQCRWNYKDEKDVYYVHGKFEELDYPYDVLWLDIEHTDGKRYFTWDQNTFPNPKEMQQKLASQGRRMVTIVDPHIKRDDKYYIHEEATTKGLYVKDKDGKDYDGWCWPGSSSYLDFTDAGARQWWANQFAYNRYKGSTPTLFTWNDMNEPSVFNGPEVSMQKDLKNLAGDEHREWHNIYGMLFHRATGEGLVQRNPTHDVRPFVLSRSFFAGSQRYGAIWTGDNEAKWSHLQTAAPMLLSMNTAALSFVGADVGGFFGNTEAELFTRWMQAGAYQPFFRGHAHHDSARREPWMFDDATLHRLRHASMTRYALLPFWYTVFHEAETTGMAVMRMMWMEYPTDEALFGLDHQYMIGSDLLVHPVVVPETSEVEVIFPLRDSWYDVDTLMAVSQSQKDSEGITSRVVQADLDKIPVYQRGGSIITRKLRLRRSSMLMKKDPYTLYVALDADMLASGTLYMDDEETFGYKKRDEYALAALSADLNAGKLQNEVTVGSGWTSKVGSMAADRMVERVIVMGVKKAPSQITVSGNAEPLSFLYDKDKQLLTIRKPEVSALQNWVMSFTF